MRKYSKQDIEKEERLGVTTKLSLYDPWRMKEKKVDIGNYIYREPPKTTTSHSITSLKKLQEQQTTPISIDADELDLSLWFSTNNNKKRKITTAENQYHSSSLPKRKKFASDSDYAVALNLWRMKNYSKQDMAEEERLGVTTNLSVYDPWRMRKDLMSSDIGHLSRLTLKSHWSEKYLLKSSIPNMIWLSNC
ncbi:hypothetical protein FEM48_Zijuj03G0090800 [Ziziphus jujuba var. spinosa]|uniref:Uncharacterized protein n=1 Tax=Ziziphus jujuba var. spinosa TaxID=714518 RepID=A0A978VPE7_ZIZJJ|nr:hypothetical protein FEM48_Zijuj03G0090800 [Ziziphus jujuba var. spinosa]